MGRKHGRYYTPSRISEEEDRCPKSPDGKHCWHKKILEWKEEEFRLFDQAFYFREPVYGKICCWCGKEEAVSKEEYERLSD
jgi:hypothetical protein